MINYSIWAYSLSPSINLAYNCDEFQSQEPLSNLNTMQKILGILRERYTL